MTTNNIAFKTKEISATSRASVKIGESYYTFEASETRTVNYEALPQNLAEAEDCINNEWMALWDTVHTQVDNQVSEIVELIRNKNKK